MHSECIHPRAASPTIWVCQNRIWLLCIFTHFSNDGHDSFTCVPWLIFWCQPRILCASSSSQRCLRIFSKIISHVFKYVKYIQGGKNAWDACMSVSAKVLLVAGLFGGKWPIKKRCLTHFGHPVDEKGASTVSQDSLTLCVMTHSHVCHDSLTCVSWLTHIKGATSSVSHTWLTCVQHHILHYVCTLTCVPRIEKVQASQYHVKMRLNLKP